jgi:uroporphyrinogen decarboxylase
MTETTLEQSMRDRMRSALQRRPVDRLPTQINYTEAMGRKLSDHFNVSLKALPDLLGNHFLRLDINYENRTTQDGTFSYDWWGVGWNTETEGYWPGDPPLAENEDLDKYVWPDPNEADLLDTAIKAIEQDSGKHFIAPNFGFCLFERAWSLRGFEQFNLDLALNQGFAAELLEQITCIQVALSKRFVGLGVDGGYFGDDYGAQKGMLFSPRTWRTLFKPRLERIFSVFREAGLPVILHSDGDIAPILPDLVEIGLTTLNPVQPEVLDLAWLKSSFGDRLSFYGGISTQTVLPFGSPNDVRQAAREAVRLLASDGRGLLLAPSHRMTADIPIENVEAMLDVFRTLGGEQ